MCLFANLAVKWILQAAHDDSDSSSAKPCKGRQQSEIAISIDCVVLHLFRNSQDAITQGLAPDRTNNRLVYYRYR